MLFNESGNHKLVHPKESYYYNHFKIVHMWEAYYYNRFKIVHMCYVKQACNDTSD